MLFDPAPPLAGPRTFQGNFSPLVPDGSKVRMLFLKDAFSDFRSTTEAFAASMFLKGTLSDFPKTALLFPRMSFQILGFTKTALLFPGFSKTPFQILDFRFYKNGFVVSWFLKDAFSDFRFTTEAFAASMFLKGTLSDFPKTALLFPRMSFQILGFTKNGFVVSWFLKDAFSDFRFTTEAFCCFHVSQKGTLSDFPKTALLFPRMSFQILGFTKTALLFPGFSKTPFQILGLPQRPLLLPCFSKAPFQIFQRLPCCFLRMSFQILGFYKNGFVVSWFLKDAFSDFRFYHRGLSCFHVSQRYPFRFSKDCLVVS
ncbi:hypothetical protein CEXT_420231 [Caerostris extrusa]|uniref:Uncharacterized protein n=1 Tax=Caerostris extrusa TaxID=172846 RepID=A0AAV4TCZ6_CAEEX|nr:hypothetical protein CEXT_420231 [Caerostris extrusa]